MIKEVLINTPKIENTNRLRERHPFSYGLNSEPLTKRDVIILAAILLLGAVLRCYRLGYQSLWSDEIFTFIGANNSLSQILFLPDKNLSIQPLYYLIVHAFIGYGNNQEVLLRLPSMIFGSLSIVLFYLVAGNLTGRTIGLISAMIFTISPFHVWYSQEARPYTMLIFLSLLSLWLLQKLLKKQTNPLLKIGFIISAASTFYSHTEGIVFIGFLVVYILLVVPHREWREWLPVFTGIFILILSALYRTALVPPIVRASQPWRPFNLLSVPYTIWAFGTGYTLGPSLTELHMPGRMSIVLSYFTIILPVLLFFSALLLLGAFQLLKQNKLISLLTALWFVFPLTFTVFGAIFTPNEFNVRYSILSFPPFILLIAAGAQSVRFKWIRISTFAVIGLISVFSLNNHYFNGLYHKENNRDAGRFLSAHAQPNDLVVCSPGYTCQDLKHYYGRDDLNMVHYPESTLYVKPDRIATDFNKIIANRENFWLFLSRTFHSDPQGYIRDFSNEHFNRDIEFISNGVELIRYTRDSL